MTNPNGANQTTSDPREQICWDFYVESITKGQVNAYESAIKAGYEESSAKNITLRGWFKERLEDLKKKEMLTKAEKVLNKTLDYEPVSEEGKIDTSLLAIQNKTAQFIAERLNKTDYSTKTLTDITTGGDKIQFNVVKYEDSRDTPQISTEEISA